jgi:hypothetical protein
MATDALVADRIERGEHLISELIERQFPVSAAVWIRTSEDNSWLLYIVSSGVDTDGLTESYRRFHTMLQTIPAARTLQFHTRLIGLTNPISLDVLALMQLWQGALPTWHHGPQLGNLAIEEAYIYAV